ncbi:MAG: AAA-like domain-containing protein [Candidatus Poribacteria bacterium]|nr:AAA-like domain-containing protein [Candidatus Poribacteria bacterium]
MRTFGTEGPVSVERNYIVSRTAELTDFIDRVKQGKYLVIFAPRQTGKTTFFQSALDKLTDEAPAYLPIELNFEAYENIEPADFYECLSEDIREGVAYVFQKRGSKFSEGLARFLETAEITDHVSMIRFFKHLASLLRNQHFVIVIDEFDGIPKTTVSGFLHSLRRIYLSRIPPRCPYSVGIVGVKSIAQLNYNRSISPFNIQDEFALPNFTLEQVQELLGQYTTEVGQVFESEVIKSIHKQTAGQPFLVNRFAQILTVELGIPKTQPLTMGHFSKAHTRLLREQNRNITHLIANIRSHPRFENLLMEIVSYDKGVDFNLDDEDISELTTYGVITEGAEGLCEIVNPIYQYQIMRAFKQPINGLERDYFPEDTRAGFRDYLTPDGYIQLQPLLDNFRDFIARAGFRILQIPNTPQEFVGQYLLFTYLDQFVRLVGGNMYLEVQTGRGRMDLIILHNRRKYIVETKIWEGASLYESGKKQLSAYLTLEDATEGYYVVFDQRQKPEPRVESERVEGVPIRSYVIPVVQTRPSSVQK